MVAGYYYNDLKIFKKSQLVIDKDYGHFIIGERDKNGNETIIPLFKFPNAANILKKYAPDAKEELVFDRSTFIEDQVYNRHLKTIAEKAGIAKVVVNKSGRHTHAQLYVRYGAKTQVLSKIMGHTKSDTTKHYYEMNLLEIVEGTKDVDFKKLGI
jgi:integrase